MKKVALVIGGEPRLVEKAFKENTIFWNWLNENYLVDVHVHSWNHKLEWNKKDHNEIRFNSIRNDSENYYPKEMTTKSVSGIKREQIEQEYSGYQPKTLVVEEYDHKRFNIGSYPLGQYISRAKGYVQAMQYDDYDYVWLTRSDCVYDSDNPVNFVYLEDFKNKILCDDVRINDEGFYTTQDWYYAGSAEAFSNLKTFVDDFELYFQNNLEQADWFTKLLEGGNLRNSHIWQGLITKSLGEDKFFHTAQGWKLLYDE